MKKSRLDLLLVERRLTETRARAQRLIMAGRVRVDGQIVLKPATRVDPSAALTIEPGPRFVSRGGEKLDAALAAFGVDVRGRVCADVGASTGGFTDCLLQRGAARVYAIDVGKGILHWKLRRDPRVVVIEETNARYLESLPEPVSLVTVDASFISLKVLLPVVRKWVAPSPLPPRPPSLSPPLGERGRGVPDRAGGEGEGGLSITITSTIPVASGLGSGAAVSVALIRALSAHLGHPLPDERVSALTYEVEKIHHGTPSGIDNTVVTYARPVYFVRGKGDEPPTIEVFSIARPFTLVIGDTGIPAPTKEAVADVRRLWEVDRARMERLFAAVGSIVRAARQAIEGGYPERLGPLMDENHALLQEMTVSSPELDRLVEAARRAGALGAKLSGGGRGGNMIALAEEGNAPAVAEALRAAGARRVIVTQVGEAQ